LTIRNRYSTLKQINKQNARRLVRGWNVSLASSYGEQAQPLVYNASCSSPCRGHGGDRISRPASRFGARRVDLDPAVPRVACCGLSTRAGGLQRQGIRGTLDAHLVALDQKTAKEVWKQKVAEWKEGFSITGAPMDRRWEWLITGISASEFGVRAFPRRL